MVTVEAANLHSQARRLPKNWQIRGVADVTAVDGGVGRAAGRTATSIALRTSGHDEVVRATLDAVDDAARQGVGRDHSRRESGHRGRVDRDLHAKCGRTMQSREDQGLSPLGKDVFRAMAQTTNG